ncbi:biotin-dependent carboxyltransferase family protein [Aliiruegeria lutimaris]|uniref:biotin-dependent carboxyltransferase family protein n=1 Tax=Aliiruegeria lutimaris TaxID=571298 RepID=UPI001FCD925B|nr:biotin-dependent carboxyltransferase family protein [Aliiruegeria lutimaris]
MTLAIASGDLIVQHNSQKTRSWTVLMVQKSERLSITAGEAGSWTFLACAGRIATADWLGNQATHSTSGFGGGAVRTGQTIALSDATVREDRLGEILQPAFPTAGPIRVVTGFQDHRFAKAGVDRFLTEKFTVSDAYDRMGMRLKGLDLPLTDHQTTGGNPKIATVTSPGIDRLVQ